MITEERLNYLKEMRLNAYYIDEKGNAHWFDLADYEHVNDDGVGEENSTVIKDGLIKWTHCIIRYRRDFETDAIVYDGDHNPETVYDCMTKEFKCEDLFEHNLEALYVKNRDKYNELMSEED